MIGAFSVKRIPLSLAGMAALFLAGLGPTMARAQGVVTSPSASARSLVGDLEPRPVIVPDSEEPEAASPAIPHPLADVPDAPPLRVAMGPLDVIHESILGAASEDDWQPLSVFDILQRGLGPAVRPVAGGDQRGAQAELVRGRRRDLRAALLAQFLFHRQPGHEPGGIAVGAASVGALETRDHRE